MLSCIFGDIVGSVYEFNPVQINDWPLLRKINSFTDDTILVCACMEWLMNAPTSTDPAEIQRRWGNGYSLPMGGYGARFLEWLSDHDAPNDSYGNGAVMRIAPVAWVDASATKVQELAQLFTRTSHNHPRAIKAVALYISLLRMLRQGYSKNEVIQFWKTYQPTFKILPINEYVEHEVIRWKSAADETLHQAVLAWYYSDDLVSAIRNSIHLQGDSDTIACVAGGLCEAQWGLPDPWIIEATFERLTPEIREWITAFYRTHGHDLRAYADIPFIHEIPRSEDAQKRWLRYPS